MSEQWEKIGFEGSQPDTGPVAYLRVTDADGDECDFLMPEELVDTILRDHELAQDATESLDREGRRVEAAEARIAELEARLHGTGGAWTSIRLLDLENLKAEAAALRELVREELAAYPAGTSIDPNKADWIRHAAKALSEKAETPATAGEG